jgi:hypothetical protein
VQVLSSVWNMMLGVRVSIHTTGKHSHTHQSRLTLRLGRVRTGHQGKRHDGQAACEPGAGGCGGVPVHPARLHTHRTSPAQALLTTLTETC